VSLVTLLLIPQVELIAADARWSGAPWTAGAAVVALAIAVLAVRPNSEHPIRSAVVYAENADSSAAWLGVLGPTTDAWARPIVGTRASPPAWARGLLGRGADPVGHRVDRIPLEAPRATLVRDTLLNGARRVVLRVTAPSGTTGLVMRVASTKVLTSSIDGRIVDTTRYRSRSPQWVMQYWAVPDTGAIVALSVAAGATVDFEMAARRPGLPSIPGVTIPPRPSYIVPSQLGDVSVVYKKMTF
jgi:hypothetical protein